jgi:hypothetical protein
MADQIDELLQACLAALAEGADFPTIWQDKLMRHPLVAGSPEQKMGADGPVLEVRLATGDRLRFGITFSFLPADLHRYFL